MMGKTMQTIVENECQIGERQESEADGFGRILVVDDIEMNRDMLSRRLIRKGYQVTCAASGQEALDLIDQDSFDVVLLDIMMPGMSGFEVLEVIRSQHGPTELPVIMATGNDGSEDVVMALTMGANDYLIKPLDILITDARVRTQIAAKKSAENLANEIRERKSAQETLALHAKKLESANEQLVSAKQELQHSLRALKHKNQALEEFSYVVSHDLQAPIRKVISFGKLLKADLGDSLNEDAEKDLGFMVDAAQRMRMLVQDLLELAKTDLARVDKSVDMNVCVDAALDILSEQVRESKAAIVKAELPTITGNETLLTQLFQNLIGNALKFVADDAPLVEITATLEGGKWIFGVKDNGIGFADGHAAHIFKPFQRLHRQNDYEGTGIGLAICNRVVQRHAGRIWVDSEPGKGSHFLFTLQMDDDA
ncbi:MAG: response regulator [Pirellulaceae bacterium]|nr:response regulator [Pirellulaceae bacterium]